MSGRAERLVPSQQRWNALTGGWSLPGMRMGYRQAQSGGCLPAIRRPSFVRSLGDPDRRVDADDLDLEPFSVGADAGDGGPCPFWQSGDHFALRARPRSRPQSSRLGDQGRQGRDFPRRDPSDTHEQTVDPGHIPKHPGQRVQPFYLDLEPVFGWIDAVDFTRYSLRHSRDDLVVQTRPGAHFHAFRLRDRQRPVTFRSRLDWILARRIRWEPPQQTAGHLASDCGQPRPARRCRRPRSEAICPAGRCR